MLAGAENPIKKAEGSTQTTNRPSVQLPALFRALLFYPCKLEILEQRSPYSEQDV